MDGGRLEREGRAIMVCSVEEDDYDDDYHRIIKQDYTHLINIQLNFYNVITLDNV